MWLATLEHHLLTTGSKDVLCGKQKYSVTLSKYFSASCHPASKFPIIALSGSFLYSARPNLLKLIKI